MLDAGERFGLGEVETIPQVNDGAENSGGFDFGAAPSRLCLGPAQGPRRAIFPKINAVAEPVPGVLARLEVAFARYDPFDESAVAPVVADD